MGAEIAGHQNQPATRHKRQATDQAGRFAIQATAIKANCTKTGRPPGKRSATDQAGRVAIQATAIKANYQDRVYTRHKTTPARAQLDACGITKPRPIGRKDTGNLRLSLGTGTRPCLSSAATTHNLHRGSDSLRDISPRSSTRAAIIQPRPIGRKDTGDLRLALGTGTRPCLSTAASTKIRSPGYRAWYNPRLHVRAWHTASPGRMPGTNHRSIEWPRWAESLTHCKPRQNAWHKPPLD
jgi:hypothetical protein